MRSKPYWTKEWFNLSPPKGVFKKLLSISPFFSKLLKSDLNLLFLIKTSSGGERRRYYQKIKQNSHWPDTCEKKCYLLFLSKCVSTCFLTCWKRKTFENLTKFHFKKGKIIFETLFSSSFDVLHSSPIVYIDHTELIDLILHQKGRRNSQSIFPILSRGWSTFPGPSSDLDIWCP